ncbi:MAG: DNA ligase D, partial [Thermoplasmata archaeon]
MKSGRTLERVGVDRNDVWHPEARETTKPDHAKRSAMPTHLSPQLAVLADHPPKGDEWLHEVKFDGYRLLAFIRSGKVRLLTRRGLDWTGKFSAIADPLSRLKADSAIIDGEAVVLDRAGRSDFQALQAMLKNEARMTPVFYAFDLPFCNGVDLRATALVARKQRLEELLKESHLAPRIRFSDHIQGHGDRIVQKACRMALEGIISKRFDSPYVSRRDPSWLKSKCVDRQEFVIIGYTDPQGLRSGLGALLLGVHDEKDRLVYAGRVGTGFNDKGLRSLRTRLEGMERDGPPTDVAPPPRERRDAHWVKPSLVAEVRFSHWTRDGVLRHPTFVALRSDKPASKIVREKPVTPEKLGPLRRTSGKAHVPPSSAATSAARTPPPVAEVRLTHPDKQLYPEQGLTKRDVAEYYGAVQKWMLPHVVDRPLSLLRCPDGLAGKCFFQRNWSETMPPAIDKIKVGGRKKREEHVIVHDIQGLLSLVQIGVLEVHCWNGVASDV